MSHPLYTVGHIQHTLILSGLDHLPKIAPHKKSPANLVMRFTENTKFRKIQKMQNDLLHFLFAVELNEENSKYTLVSFIITAVYFFLFER